jgi:predicted transcriptional regulator
LANRNIDINKETWSKVGVMAATMNKTKKTIVAEALENYYKLAVMKYPEIKK